jgi:hypothetical protein
MMLDLEPLLRPVAIDELRPTQMTVGFREVERKRRQWRARVEKDGGDYLGRHMIPVVIGPGDRHWMIDNHHLARALHEEGVKDVLVRVIADLGGLKGRLFRTFMDNRNWFHPFDAEGHRRELAKIPRHVKGLTDDPYRSLAGELRRAGGYAKDDTPYSEFLWADFLRRRVSLHLVSDKFESAVEKALQLANDRTAAYLPGWAGVED